MKHATAASIHASKTLQFTCRHKLRQKLKVDVIEKCVRVCTGVYVALLQILKNNFAISAAFE